MNQNPPQHSAWRGAAWMLPALLSLLGMLGPFSIDAYLPAFTVIAQDLNASELQMQQTLSIYLAGFAFMNLFHGALSDSFGRRIVVLVSLVVFALSVAVCAMASSYEVFMSGRLLQGLSAGAGFVIAKAIVRDLYPPAQAQRVMSQVILYFGVAPAIAPVVGAFCLAHGGWRGIFWALLGFTVAITILNWRVLPETLREADRQSFAPSNLLRGYRQIALSPAFLLLAVASTVPFNSMFMYVLAAPAFLGQHLQLAPDQFFWLFIIIIAGIMGGAFTSGRVAGKIPPARQVYLGFVIMAVVTAVNLLAYFVLPVSASWALLPIGLFSYGWALMVPSINLLVMDLVPDRRGMAASLHAAIGSAFNALVAGVIAPWVMGSAVDLAITAAIFCFVGLFAWGLLRKYWVAATNPQG